MKWGYAFIIAFVGFFALSHEVRAQDIGEITQDPICFTIVNTAPHKVYGTVRTNLYPVPDGGFSRHSSNFRLDAKGSVHKDEGYPLDSVEFCSHGPFYDGRKLEFVIKTLFPVFSCYTNIESGPIVIRSKRIETGNRMWAECFE